MRKPAAERSIPSMQDLREEALVALESWGNKEDRIRY